MKVSSTPLFPSINHIPREAPSPALPNQIRTTHDARRTTHDAPWGLPPPFPIESLLTPRGASSLTAERRISRGYNNNNNNSGSLRSVCSRWSSVVTALSTSLPRGLPLCVRDVLGNSLTHVEVFSLQQIFTGLPCHRVGRPSGRRRAIGTRNLTHQGSPQRIMGPPPLPLRRHLWHLSISHRLLHSSRECRPVCRA